MRFGSEKENLFQLIIGKLKLFEPYLKIEILDLLGTFTHLGINSIYINQEKVFSSIAENKNFLFSHLFKLILSNDNQVNIEYRVQIGKEFESMCEDF